MKPSTKSVLVSGIKPSGDLHIGNYIGALSQWTDIQNDYRCLVFIADYHSITVKQDPEKLRAATINLTRAYLAAGMDPKKVTIFKQSDIAGHTELGWILNTITKVSELEKMTQYKDKSREQKKEGPGAGLLNYPTLMAADILLYQAEIVPVGDDQTQHLEITRMLGRRFNQLFGETFVIPKALVRETGSRIMSLDDPTKKMSKSGSGNNCIFLDDDSVVAHKKIKRAVTDSGSDIRFDEKKKPAISNLLTIYSALAHVSIKELEIRYAGKIYGEFKEDLANIVANFLEDFQERAKTFSDSEVKKILNEGAVIAKSISEKTMKTVKTNLGLI